MNDEQFAELMGEVRGMRADIGCIAVAIIVMALITILGFLFT